MRKLLLITLFFIGYAIGDVTGMIVTAQKREETPKPLPQIPYAVARLCQNGGVVNASEVYDREALMRSFGCDVSIKPLGEGYFLIYGTYILYAE